MKHLAADHEITVYLAGPVPLSSDLAAVEALGVQVDVIPVSSGAGMVRMGKAPFDRRPLQSLPLSGRRARRRVAEMAEGADLIHAQTVRTAPLLPPGGPPVVLDLIDAMSVNLRRRAEHDRTPRGVAARLEARRISRYERALAQAGVTIVAATEADAAALGSALVVPNGVDLDHFHYRSEGHDPSVLVFGGNLGYFPNIDAARMAATEVLPIVAAARPGTTLVVAGARPAAAIRRLAAALRDVRLVPQPEDLGAVVAGAGVAVIPMRAGTGMQNKVLEAMAVGTPVVTTPRAAEAVGAAAGEHLRVGTGAREIAEEVIGILDDPTAAQAMVQRARRFVEERYGWAGCAARLGAIWESTARG